MEQITAIIQAAGALGTFLLVIVYIFQHKILTKQADAMQAGFTPVIEINSVSADPEDVNDTDEKDRLKLKMSNVGNAVAKDLELESRIYLSDETISDKVKNLSPFINNIPLSGFRSPIYNNERNVYDRETRGAVLGVNAKEATCTAMIQLSRTNGSSLTSETLFSNAVNDIAGQRVKFELTVIYESAVGEVTRIPISPGIEFTAREEIGSFYELYQTAKQNSSTEESGEKKLPGAEAVFCDHSEI